MSSDTENTNPDIAILGTFKDNVEEAEAALDALYGESSPDKEKALASLRNAVQFFSNFVPYFESLFQDDDISPNAPYGVSCGLVDCRSTPWCSSEQIAKQKWRDLVPKEISKENEEKKEHEMNDVRPPKNEPINNPSQMTWYLANRQIKAKKAILDYFKSRCQKLTQSTNILARYIAERNASTDLTSISVGIASIAESINSLHPILSTLLGIDEENTEHDTETTPDSP